MVDVVNECYDLHVDMMQKDKVQNKDGGNWNGEWTARTKRVRDTMLDASNQFFHVWREIHTEYSNSALSHRSQHGPYSRPR